MKDLLERLKNDFEDPDARYAYADSVVNAFVSAQIKALREDRGLTQEKLAELIGTKQSGISRLQKADYGAWKIETLRRIARAFGVRLRLGFEEFGTILEEIGNFGEEKLAPRRFEEDPVFQSKEQKAMVTLGSIPTSSSGQEPALWPLQPHEENGIRRVLAPKSEYRKRRGAA